MPAMRLTEYGKSRTALPGVPWRELTAHEWAEAKRRHPGIDDQGYFEPVPDEPEPTSKIAVETIEWDTESGNETPDGSADDTKPGPGEPRKRSK